MSIEPREDNLLENHARLEGEKLAAWYRQGVPERTDPLPEMSDGWKPADKLVAIGIVLGVYILLLTTLGFVFPFFSGALVGVAALWVVLGSGNLWLRVGGTALLTCILGFGYPEIMAFLLIVVAFTSSVGYLASLVAAHTRRMPTRVVQFSLWDAGGCTLALAAGLALLRGSGFDFDRFEETGLGVYFVATAFLYAVNVLLAACPVIVPRSYRGYRWWVFAGVMTLIVLPYLELEFCERFRIGLVLWFDRPYSFVIRNPDATILFQHFSFLLAQVPSTSDNGWVIYPIHVGAVMIVWISIVTIEGIGGFCEVDTEKLTAPPEGPLD